MTQSPTAKNKPEKGFTQILNAVIDNQNLSIRDKMVLIKLVRHCYGKSWTFVSQQKIAKHLGASRVTVKAALDSLTALGVIKPRGKGRSGVSETYTIDLDFAANLSNHHTGSLSNQYTGTCTVSRQGPVQPVDTNHTNQITLNNKPAESEVTSAAVARVERGVAGVDGHDFDQLITFQHELPVQPVDRSDFEAEEAA